MSESPEMKIPVHVSRPMRSWVQSICDRYAIQSQHFKLLILAAEAWDRCQSARESLRKKGTTYEDRFGAPRARPEIAIERDGRLAFIRCVRELSLENESPSFTSEARPRVAPKIPRRKD